MMPPKALLDTDIVSDIMRPPSKSGHNASVYYSFYKRFNFSMITRYEILRGLKAKRATRQLAGFEIICQESDVLPVDDRIIVRASDIYAELKCSGQLIGDADILIAATALEHNLTLVTNNEKHFARIPRLTIANWTHS